MQGTTTKGMEAISNPEIGAELMTTLFHGDKRAKKLAGEIAKEMDVSEQTVYSILQELIEKGLIEKDERSRRNVIYRLTERGREVIIEEEFKTRDAISIAIRNAPHPKEIIIDIFLDDIIRQLPKEWREPRKREMLRKYFEEVIENTKKAFISLATASEG